MAYESDPDKNIPKLLVLASTDPDVFDKFAAFAKEIIENHPKPPSPKSVKVQWDTDCVNTYNHPC